MRTLSISFIVVALLFAGCKKSSSNNPGSKTYLLSKATYTNTPGTYSAVDHYAYDDKNRVIELNSQRASRDFKYTYDSNNNLATVNTYENNSLYSTDTY